MCDGPCKNQALVAKLGVELLNNQFKRIKKRMISFYLVYKIILAKLFPFFKNIILMNGLEFKY